MLLSNLLKVKFSGEFYSDIGSDSTVFWYLMIFYLFCITFHANFCYIRNKASFHFPEDQQLKQKWTSFVNRKNWSPSAHSAICINHFEGKFIKRGKNVSSSSNFIQYLHFIMTQNLKNSHHYHEISQKTKKWRRWISFTSSCWSDSWIWLNIRTEFARKLHL